MWRIDKFVRCAQTARWCITASAGQAGPALDGEYPVVLDGRRLFTIKAPRAPYNTQQRAKNISDDLLAVAEDEQVSAADMRIVPLQTDSSSWPAICLSLRSPMRMGNACVASQIASGQHGRHRRIQGSGVSWEKTR